MFHRNEQHIDHQRSRFGFFTAMLTAFVLATPLAFTGCEDNDGPVEEAAEGIEDTVEEVGDEVEEATD